MTVINTNISATLTANALTKNERAMGQTMERLSTGLRINSAADDAAGLAISSKMTSQINGLNQAARNSNDAISMLQTADGALIEVSNMLQRMRELAIQAASGTNTASDQSNLDTEFQSLKAGIESIVRNTQWNGENILAGGTAGAAVAKNFQVGANATQTLQVTFADFNIVQGTTANTDASAAGPLAVLDIDGAAGSGTAQDLNSLVIYHATPATAVTEISKAVYGIDDAIGKINTERAKFGAAINSLEYTVDNLTNVSQNTAASRSRIQDADYAAETTELARTQIIQQAGTAMLSQANQQAQSVLALLK
jgi:flagellin